MHGLNELQGMNMLALAEKLRLTDDEFDEWLVELGLLHGRQECDTCQGQMKLNGNRLAKIWICHRRACRNGNSKPKKGYLNGTFFEGSTIPIKKIFQLSYYWAHSLGTQEHQEFETEISHPTVVQWHQYFRDVCAQHIVQNPQQIGGPNEIVEIDETCLSKRKYNRGRLMRPNQWMFGGIQRGTRRAFMQLVDRRDAATLLPIIQQFVLPGTTIMSDLWRAYGGIQGLPQGYQHLTVNHSINFVDPNTGAHTQSIESTWNRFKSKVKKSHGLNTSSQERYTDYLQEFMWRQLFGQRDQVLFNFWSQVSTLYPCLN